MILDRLDFTLESGQRIAVTGSVGAGKPSLLHIIMGLIKPQSGHIELFGEERLNEKDFQKIRGRAGLLFQDSEDQLFCPTVLEDVCFGPLNQGRGRTEAATAARKVLESLGIAKLAHRVIPRLSGGEKKLTALAGLLVMNPEILLLDEPTAGLDDATRNLMIKELLKLDAAIMMISHDRIFIDALAEREMILCDGRLL